MKYYAVIDTNVLIAALLSKKSDSATVLVLHSILSGKIIPLYHKEIIEEYNEVLHRPKFNLNDKTIKIVLDSIIQNGVEVIPTPTGEILPDIDDSIFYEVAMEKQGDNAYLVTGNQKHYPVKKFIVTPTQMMEIIKNEK